jgi:hypothetical protein
MHWRPLPCLILVDDNQPCSPSTLLPRISLVEHAARTRAPVQKHVRQQYFCCSWAELSHRRASANGLMQILKTWCLPLVFLHHIHPKTSQIAYEASSSINLKPLKRQLLKQLNQHDRRSFLDHPLRFRRNAHWRGDHLAERPDRSDQT